MKDKPRSSHEGFRVLPGGSYRDRGLQLGTRTAGELAGIAVNSLMGEEMGERLSTQRKVMNVWRKMPEVWQRHCQGITIRPRRTSSELVVFLDSSAWVYELSMRRDELMRRWNELVEADETPCESDCHVSSVHFRLSGRAYEEGERNALMLDPTLADPDPELIPLDEGERAHVEDTCGNIVDDDLRERVEETMTAVLEWKKSKKD